VAEQRHPLDTPASNETAEIKGEIARTRVEMSETLGEIQDRLRPDHLLQQAKDGVTNAAAGKVRTMMYSAREGASVVASRSRDAGTYLADYATAHPIRIAVTIGAVTWWMLRGRDRSHQWDGIAETRWDDESPNAVGLEGDYDSAFGGSARRPLREKVGEIASTARETVGEYAATARETVGEYASTARETVGEYASSARTSAQRATARVGGAARSAGSTVDGFARDNPLAAGAIALAIGAAIAMLAPRTELEDTAMGETRDRAWQKASRAAASLKDTVAEKVATAAENLVGESLAKAAEGTPSDPIGRA
jgi:ElaB/YqjD/DUF883 family membrane-anchored ribosome-binding protein